MFSPSLPHPLWSCSLPSVSHSSLTSPSQSFSPCFLKLFSPLQIFADPSLRAVSIYDVTEPLANSHLCKQKLTLGKSCFHFFDYSHNIISRCNPCPKQFTVLPTLQHLTREKEARRKALNPSTFPCPMGCSSDASSSRLDGETRPPGSTHGRRAAPSTLSSDRLLSCLLPERRLASRDPRWAQSEQRVVGSGQGTVGRGQVAGVGREQWAGSWEQAGNGQGLGREQGAGQGMGRSRQGAEKEQAGSSRQVLGVLG